MTPYWLLAGVLSPDIMIRILLLIEMDGVAATVSELQQDLIDLDN